MPARGSRRAVVGLLTGCVQGAFFPQVNAATARVLQAEGCDVVVPREQGCCGALSTHNGREAEAQRFARRLVDTFEAARVEHVVVNAAGCGSTMKEYAELLADDPSYADRARAFAEKVRDVSEILDELGPVAPATYVELRSAIITVMAVLALAYVTNLSGQTAALGAWLAGTGAAFAVISPVLSWMVP